MQPNDVIPRTLWRRDLCKSDQSILASIFSICPESVHAPDVIDEWILAVLRHELESAKKRHQEAREQFWKISGRPREILPRDVAGRLNSEVSPRILAAAAEETRARKAHLAALTRMNEFLIRGTVPEHLKKEEKTNPVTN
jgi:hypothetical protein